MPHCASTGIGQIYVASRGVCDGFGGQVTLGDLERRAAVRNRRHRFADGRENRLELPRTVQFGEDRFARGIEPNFQFNCLAEPLDRFGPLLCKCERAGQLVGDSGFVSGRSK